MSTGHVFWLVLVLGSLARVVWRLLRRFARRAASG